MGVGVLILPYLLFIFCLVASVFVCYCDDCDLDACGGAYLFMAALLIIGLCCVGILCPVHEVPRSHCPSIFGTGNKPGPCVTCPQCKRYFCLDCDIYIHESLHNCPGCESFKHN